MLKNEIWIGKPGEGRIIKDRLKEVLQKTPVCYECGEYAFFELFLE